MEFTTSAEKEFSRLPGNTARRFGSAIAILVGNPRRRKVGADVKRLHGMKNTWRLRVGDGRGIYEIEGAGIVFTRLGHRAKVYFP